MPSIPKRIPPMTHRAHEPETQLTVLLGAVAGGDLDSLALLYRQVEGRIYAFALSRLNNSEVAADVVQEVILTVWRRAGSFGGRSKALSWIFGITHHKIIDVLRRRGRWQTEPTDEDAMDMVSPTPFAEAVDGQRREAVRRALASLPDRHRQVVHLAFFEGLPYPEIAHILEIPTGTVKTRMFHAKKTLAKRLQSHLGAAK